MTARAYHVSGTWPFPTDMLRYDGARPATDEDAEKIRRLSGPASDRGYGLRDRVTVTLIHEPAHAFILPAWRRWESFDWQVEGCLAVDIERNADAARKRRDALVQSGLEKLTDDEIKALGLEGKRP